jgi:O-succinylbenzoic acid--CoA ligase
MPCIPSELKGNESEIDWESSNSHLFLNPRGDEKANERASVLLPIDHEFAGHIWLATSGSTAAVGQSIKYAAIPKSAFLLSARAVIEHLEVCSKDVWVSPLPNFHVGGLAILARSYLSGMKVFSVRGKWQLQNYLDAIDDSKGTLSSLVPAQIFDIVSARVKAPPTLKAILVGGGRLSPVLYLRAKELGWPLLPSYGMTEAASTIASAPLHWMKSDYPPMLLLPHIELEVDEQHCFKFLGGSLLTAYAEISVDSCNIYDPKKEGWFSSSDRGLKNGNEVELWGRITDFVKIGGESVELTKLEALLDELKIELGCCQDIALLAVPNDRLGHRIALVIAGPSNDIIERLVSTYQQRVMPFEQIRSTHHLQVLPRTPLGKLQRSLLLNSIS